MGKDGEVRSAAGTFDRDLSFVSTHVTRESKAGRQTEISPLPARFVYDIIEPGAHLNSISKEGAGFPLLWSHKQNEPYWTGACRQE